MTRVYGSKYDTNLTTVEIAKRFREDVKAAIKAGDLPKGLKVSAPAKHFSGGSSIHAVITACPVRVLNPARVAVEYANPHDHIGGNPPRHTEEATALLAKLNEMLRAYNHDGSDIMTDYFDVNFYGDVTFHWELEHAEREKLIAALALDHGAGV